MLMKTKEMRVKGGNVVENAGAAGLGAGDWGMRVPADAASQHHSPNLSCGSRKSTNLEK